MAGMLRKTFATPDETRPFKDAKGRLDLVTVDHGGTVGLATFEPGWKWSDHVKPIAGTDSCQTAHAGYVLSGRLTVRMDDGEEVEFGPGDVMVCDPGHDAWTSGDEACVIVDWKGATTYAK